MHSEQENTWQAMYDHMACGRFEDITRRKESGGRHHQMTER